MLNLTARNTRYKSYGSLKCLLIWGLDKIKIKISHSYFSAPNNLFSLLLMNVTHIYFVEIVKVDACQFDKKILKFFSQKCFILYSKIICWLVVLLKFYFRLRSTRYISLFTFDYYVYWTLDYWIIQESLVQIILYNECPLKYTISKQPSKKWFTGLSFSNLWIKIFFGKSVWKI